MRQPSTLADLLEELRGLDDRELPRVLASLTHRERKQVLALLDESDGAEEPNFALLVELSPWLADRLKAARAGRSQAALQPAMTTATCEALRQAEKQLGAARSAPGRTSSTPAPPSLAERLFGRPVAAGRAR